MFTCYNSAVYDSDDSYCSDDDDDDDDEVDDEILHSIARSFRKKYERKPTEKGNGELCVEFALKPVQKLKHKINPFPQYDKLKMSSWY